MAISATQIATSNTLENFRQQFNNLQTDVNGLESGTLTFSSVSATTTSTSALNILEDGTIVFEGATDDGNETTLTVTQTLLPIEQSHYQTQLEQFSYQIQLTLHS